MLQKCSTSGLHVLLDVFIHWPVVVVEAKNSKWAKVVRLFLKTPIRAPWEKINIHLIIILLRALSCIRVVMNTFMFHVCAGRPYTILVTTHSKMFYPYLPYRKNVECGNQFSSSCEVIHPIIVTPNHSDPFIVTFIQSNIVTSIRANQYKQKLCDVRVLGLEVLY